MRGKIHNTDCKDGLGRGGWRPPRWYHNSLQLPVHQTTEARMCNKLSTDRIRASTPCVWSSINVPEQCPFPESRRMRGERFVLRATSRAERGEYVIGLGEGEA